MTFGVTRALAVRTTGTMRGATAQLGALAVFASAALFLAGTSTMRRIELTGEQFSQHSANGYVHLTDNNGFGTNAAFIDKGNLPEGMADGTRGGVLMDKHVQNVAPEGGYIDVTAKQVVAAPCALWPAGGTSGGCAREKLSRLLGPSCEL